MTIAVSERGRRMRATTLSVSLLPAVLSALAISSRHRRQRAATGKPGDEVADDIVAHVLQRLLGGARDMRRHHDIVELEEHLRHDRLVEKDIETGGAQALFGKC